MHIYHCKSSDTEISQFLTKVGQKSMKKVIKRDKNISFSKVCVKRGNTHTFCKLKRKDCITNLSQSISQFLPCSKIKDMLKKSKCTQKSLQNGY